MVMFLLLDFCEDFDVLRRVVEVLAAHGTSVVQFRVFRLGSSLNSSVHCFKVLTKLILVLVDVISSLLEIVLLATDLHQLSGGSVEVRLELLQLTTLLEKTFRSSTALVLQNLLALQVSALCSLHEFVSVVSVSDLQVVEGVGKSLDLTLTLSDLAVEVISVTL